MAGNQSNRKRIVVDWRAEEEIIEEIKKLEAKNDEVIKAVEEMKKTGVEVLRNKKWQIEDDLVLKKEKYMFWEMISWDWRLFNFIIICQ